MDSAFLITAFATLFVVIDPPGLVPLFIALTQGMDAPHRRRLAQRACIIAFILLTLFGLAGAVRSCWRNPAGVHWHHHARLPYRGRDFAVSDSPRHAVRTPHPAAGRPACRP